MTSLQRERGYPYVIGLLAMGWTVGVDKLGYVVPYNDNMLAALLSLGGIFAGFLATLKTLLAAMDSSTYQLLKDSGYLNDLVRYLKEAIWGALLLCVVTVFGFSGAIAMPAVHAVVLFGLLAFSLAGLYRVTVVGLNLLMSR